MASEFSPGFFSGIKITVDDKFVWFESPIGPQSGKVLKSRIESIVVSPISKLEAYLQFKGEGKVLASLSTGTSWAEKSHAWLTKELNL
jgi:hypothetical protein